MSDISKHHTEQEREGHTSKNCWVDLFVSWYSVSIDDLLEHLCELILPEETGWLYVMTVDGGEGRLLNILVSLSHLIHCILHVLEISLCNPSESQVDSVLSL